MVIPQTVRGPKRFYWDIVCNNYTDEECESVKATFENIGDAFIIGKEVGESGTPHLQMMIKLKKGNYKSYLIKKLGSRFSIREGRNIEAMKAYCMKDNVWASWNIERIKNNNIRNIWDGINIGEFREVDFRRHIRQYEEASNGNIYRSEQNFRHGEE